MKDLIQKTRGKCQSLSGSVKIVLWSVKSLEITFILSGWSGKMNDASYDCSVISIAKWCTGLWQQQGNRILISTSNHFCDLMYKLIHTFHSNPLPHTFCIKAPLISPCYPVCEDLLQTILHQWIEVKTLFIRYTTYL